MRGEQNKDYWCFADGLCFYSIEKLRALYPHYNDLDEDDILLVEANGTVIHVAGHHVTAW